MRWSGCVLQQVEDEEVEKTRATFHRKPQPCGSMGRATEEVAGLNPAGEQIFFSKINTFAYTFFLISALMTLLLGITSTHRNRTWAKLNAHLLGTRICWLLIDSYFGSFIAARWRHWCRGRTVNSCRTFLSKPHRQTLVNHLNCGFNPTLSQTFFFSFWTFLKHVFIFFILLYCNGTYFLGQCLAQLALFASHQYWHVRWAWLHVIHQTWALEGSLLMVSFISKYVYLYINKQSQGRHVAINTKLCVDTPVT